MNKTDLIASIAESTGWTKEKAKTAVESVVGSITDALKNGEKVQITGFGSWEVKVRAARKGRNPKTGEEIQIEEKKVTKFKPSKSLNETLN